MKILLIKLVIGLTEDLILQESIAVCWRTTLRMCSAFGIILGDAAFTILGMMPIVILPDEVTSVHNLSLISPLSEKNWWDYNYSLTQFLTGMEDIASIHTDLKWTPHPLVQTAMMIRRIQNNVQDSWKKEGTLNRKLVQKIWYEGC